MTDVRAETDKLLSERPELEDDLQTLLTIDADGSWSFDDIPLDSGTFGEIAATAVIESTDDAYTIRDRAAVQAAIEENQTQEPDSNLSPAAAETTQTNAAETSKVAITALRQRTTTVLSYVTTVDSGRILLVGLLLFVFVMRTAISWDGVFREGHIVLLGNDPYAYRYWLEELIRTPTPLATIAAHSEPLMLASLWIVTILLGGSTHVAGLVLAWYPVVAAVIVGGLLYWSTAIAFNDQRIGFATVAFYAITPILNYRSGLGFGDHHAFDYLLLTVTIFGLVALAADTSRWRTITTRRVIGSAATVIGSAGVVHAWNGGPLLVAPVAVYLFFRSSVDLRAGRDALRTNAWLIGSLGCSAIIAIGINQVLNWSGTFQASTPLILFGVGVLLTSIASLGYRYELTPSIIIASEICGGILFLGILWVSTPSIQTFIIDGISTVTGTKGTGIVETYGLFNTESSGITTPVFYFGTAFILSIFGLGRVTYSELKTSRPARLVLITYGWTLFAAGVFQLRFAAHLGILLAIFAGVAFVLLLEKLDLSTPDVTYSSQSKSQSASQTSISVPTKRMMGTILLLFVLIGGFGMIATVDQTNQTEVTEAEFNAAQAINDHATEANIGGSASYVFSTWGENRIYNYFVSGRSRSYTYAKNNYKEFITSTDPAQAEDKLRGKYGYLVIQPLPTTSGGRVPPEMMQARLNRHFGSATDQTDGLGRYRLIHIGSDKKVYHVVPGATVRWNGEPETTQIIKTTARIDEQLTSYRRRVTSDSTGTFSVQVPYPGEYEFSDLNTTVTVPESALTESTIVRPHP